MINIYDSQEKWNAFLKETEQKQTIIKQWFGKFTKEATSYFSSKDAVKGWSFTPLGDYYLHWFLTEFGADSLSLVFGWYGKVVLYCNSDIYDILKIAEYLITEKYSPIPACGINYLVNSKIQSGAMGVRTYKFGNPAEPRFDPDQFAWIAGNRTEFLVKQIAEQVNIVRKDGKMVELLNEINKLKGIDKNT